MVGGKQVHFTTIFSLYIVEYRYSEIEAIVILAMFVKQYKIEVQDEPEFAHETFEQRKERVLRVTTGLTLTSVYLRPDFRYLLTSL